MAWRDSRSRTRSSAPFVPPTGANRAQSRGETDVHADGAVPDRNRVRILRVLAAAALLHAVAARAVPQSDRRVRRRTRELGGTPAAPRDPEPVRPGPRLAPARLARRSHEVVAHRVAARLLAPGSLRHRIGRDR